MTQIVQYFHGIGVKKWYPEKLIDGVSGSGCEELIKDVYQVCRVVSSSRLHILRRQKSNIFQYCCANIKSPADELWFFGFSRGACR